MTGTTRTFALAFAFGALLASNLPSEAGALRLRVPILIEHGQILLQAGDGALPSPLDTDPDLLAASAGYLCNYAAVAGANLWTTGCEPVAFRGDTFWRTDAIADAVTAAHGRFAAQMSFWRAQGRLVLFGAVVLLVVGGIAIARLRARKTETGEGEDRESQPKPVERPSGREALQRWAQGALAICTGSATDPAQLGVELGRRALSRRWGTRDRAQVRSRLLRYARGETTVAFDKLRIVRLARLARGAGWLSREESWRWVAYAAEAVQTRYAGWADAAQGFVDGLAQAHGNDPAAIRIARERQASAFAHVLRACPFDIDVPAPPSPRRAHRPSSPRLPVAHRAPIQQERSRIRPMPRLRRLA